jgi:hypothetical protein
LKGEIADKPLASLTEDALAAWRKGLPKTIAPATVRRIATDFGAALNAAAKAHRKALPPDFPAIVQHGLAIKEPAVAGAREALLTPHGRSTLRAAGVAISRVSCSRWHPQARGFLKLSA